MEEQNAESTIEIGDSGFPVWKAAEVVAYPALGAVFGFFLEKSGQLQYGLPIFLLLGLIGGARKYFGIRYSSAVFDSTAKKLTITERGAPNIFSVVSCEYPFEGIGEFAETTEIDSQRRHHLTTYILGIRIVFKDAGSKTVWRVRNREKIRELAGALGLPYHSIEEKNEEYIENLSRRFPEAGKVLFPQKGTAGSGFSAGRKASFNNYPQAGFMIFGIAIIAAACIKIFAGSSPLNWIAAVFIAVALYFISKIRIFSIEFDLEGKTATVSKRELLSLFKQDKLQNAQILSIVKEKIVAGKVNGIIQYDINYVFKVAGMDEIKISDRRERAEEVLREIADGMGIKIEEVGKPGGFGAKFFGA